MPRKSLIISILCVISIIAGSAALILNKNQTETVRPVIKDVPSFKVEYDRAQLPAATQ